MRRRAFAGARAERSVEKELKRVRKLQEKKKKREIKTVARGQEKGCWFKLH
jgi:hypothetical protein